MKTGHWRIFAIALFALALGIPATSWASGLSSGSSDRRGFGAKNFWVVRLDATGNIVWQRSLGDTRLGYARSVRQTMDGGYIVAGAAGPNSWVVKLNAAGETEWQKVFPGPGASEVRDIQQTTDGGYIFTGGTSGCSNRVDIPRRHGIRESFARFTTALLSFARITTNAWIVRLNAEREIVWQRVFDRATTDLGQAIQQTADGGYIVAALSSSGGPRGLFNFWIIRLDAAGEIAWERSLPGPGSDHVYSIQQTMDGGYIVVGGTSSNERRGSDGWVVKLDAAGNIIWQRTLGGSRRDLLYSGRQTKDGGYIVAGRSNSNDGNVSGNRGGTDGWVVRLGAAGNIIWQRSLGGSGRDHFRSVQQTADGGYIVAGYSNSNDGDVSGNRGGTDGWVVRLDAAGDIVWQRSLGGSGDDRFYSVQQTEDGGFIIAGGSNSTDGDLYDLEQTSCAQRSQPLPVFLPVQKYCTLASNNSPCFPWQPSEHRSP